MLDHIAGRLREAQLSNVELKLVPPDDPQLPAGGFDTILMVDTIHYIKDRAAYARKLREALAPGGRLVIVDFRRDPDAQREFAPPLEQQVARETLDAEMATCGLQPVAAYDFLPEQYFVVYAAR
jgi:SAM-dependent methyltransferase